MLLFPVGMGKTGARQGEWLGLPKDDGEKKIHMSARLNFVKKGVKSFATAL